MTWIKELTIEQVEAAFDELHEKIDSLGQLSTIEPAAVISGSIWLNEETGKISVYQNGAWETYSKD